MGKGVYKLYLNICLCENQETFHVNARFIHWREPEQVPKCVSSTLTRIFLGSFGCVKYERTMVKYFLNNAKVLKSMELLTYNVDELKKENTLQKILRFQRASQACQIKLSWELDDMDGESRFGNVHRVRCPWQLGYFLWDASNFTLLWCPKVKI